MCAGIQRLVPLVSVVQVRRVSIGKEPGEKLLTSNVWAWNAVISACGKSMEWDEAFGLQGMMVHQMLAPDATSCNAVISASEKGK